MARTNTPINITITTAVTGGLSSEIDVPVNTKSIAMQSIFTYGSGGTTTKAWLQTTFDGTTWCDISSHAFTTTTATKVSNVISTLAVTPVAPTDGTLADNTNTSGLVGNKIRVKYTTAGTYAASTTLVSTVVFA